MPDHRRRTTRPARRPGGPGFTLIELLVVIAIIGILVTFILIAAQDGVRRAEEKATQTLIAKLEMGVAERIEAILLKRADISFGHHFLAAVFNTGFPASTDPTVIGQFDSQGNVIRNGLVQMFGASPNCLPSYQRAQVIAQFDLIRAELPDVFILQSIEDARNGTTYASNYPLNFAGLDFPSGTGNYLIPLGAYSSGAPGKPATGTQPGDPNQAVGILGATFQAAGGIYKNLGYLPQGYDGSDNNGNGLVDELAEGTGGSASRQAQIAANLAAHKHETARSEMLYALLVEGVGPLGSTFSRDEFTNRQVQDTDNDGLPEFIDAWGHPLQFYRWPIFYNNLSGTTVQSAPYSSTNPAPSGYVAKGTDPYNGTWDNLPMETRQIDPLDPNQTLTSIAWWANPPNGSAASGTAKSSGAVSFESYFHSLTDPNAGSLSAAQKTGGAMWDRSGTYARRAFYSRFLILSYGPDEAPGVGVAGVGPTTGPSGVPYLTSIENAALVVDPTSSGDDITNQAMASPTGGVR